jgi:hypothetical protein
VTRTIRLTLALAFLVLACKSSGDTSPPAEEDTAGPESDAGADGDAATPSDVPPAVAELEPVPGAKELGSKMWRRFGKGEWTAHSYFVPDAKAKAVTVVVDMEGGGEATTDPFDLVLEPQGLTMVEGEPKIDGRVPPGMKRRAQWKFTAAQAGIAKIRFVTTIYRCTGSEAGDAGTAESKRATYCCAKGKGDSGENCEPMVDAVDSLESCMKAKKFNLSCDGEAVCTGKNCKCKK